MKNDKYLESLLKSNVIKNMGECKVQEARLFALDLKSFVEFFSENEGKSSVGKDKDNNEVRSFTVERNFTVNRSYNVVKPKQTLSVKIVGDKMEVALVTDHTLKFGKGTKYLASNKVLKVDEKTETATLESTNYGTKGVFNFHLTKSEIVPRTQDRQA